jgi:hypothetical protein
MRNLRTILLVLVLAYLGACVIGYFVVTPPLDVARAECARRGYAANELSLGGYRSQMNLIGMTETVEFRVTGAKPPKKVVVELRQPAYFLPWEVVEVRESAP